MAPTTPERPKNTKKHHSPHKRTRIAVMYQKGVSAKAIAAEEGVSPGAVRKIEARYRVQKSGKSQPRSGRPPKITERDKRHINRLITEDPFISTRLIAEKIGGHVVGATVLIYLRAQGIQHTKALRRPKLTEDTAKLRLDFALKHRNKPVSYWKRWIFQDESTVQRGQGERIKWVFCRRGEKILPQNVQGKIKPTRHGQMFMGAFGFGRRSALLDLHGNPDAKRKGITGEIILAALQEILPTVCEPGTIYAQDNAPTHTAAIVQNWLQPWAEENGVVLVDWPPYSPDLNPIENVWKLLKERICKLEPKLSDMPKNAKSLELLRITALKVWEAFEEEVFDHLVEAMNNRIEAVIAAKGWYTKY